MSISCTNAYAMPVEHLFSKHLATMGKVLAIVDRYIVMHVIKRRKFLPRDLRENLLQSPSLRSTSNGEVSSWPINDGHPRAFVGPDFASTGLSVRGSRQVELALSARNTCSVHNPSRLGEQGNRAFTG